MDDPVNQHLVPKVYLRPFCIPLKKQEQVYVHDFSTGRSFCASIGKVAVQHHFYTLNLAIERPSYEIENALCKIESDVQPLITELIQTQTLFVDPQKRERFSKFLATLLMRSRQSLEVIYAFREEVRSGLVKGNANPHHDKLAADELFSLDTNGMRELFAKFVIKLARPLSEKFESMNWRLLLAEEDHFVTSENPLVIYNETDERWGLGSKGTHIHLPISPKHLLVFSNKTSDTTDGTFPISKTGVIGINGLTVLGAERYLFSHANFEVLPNLLIDRPSGTKRAFGPQRQHTLVAPSKV
jgi:hypothetical protein